MISRMRTSPLTMLPSFVAGATVAVLVRRHATLVECSAWRPCCARAVGGSEADGGLRARTSRLRSWCGVCSLLEGRHVPRLFNPASIASWRGLLADGSCVVWLVYMMYISDVGTYTWPWYWSMGTLVGTVLASLFIYGSTAAGGSSGLAARFLAFPGFTSFGPYALSFYIFHGDGIVLFENADDQNMHRLSVLEPKAVLLYFCSMWAVAALYCELVEAPFVVITQRWVQRL